MYCSIFYNISYNPLQLDCRSARRTRKIDLPANQKGCDDYETIVRKHSAWRIQICQVHFSVIMF